MLAASGLGALTLSVVEGVEQLEHIFWPISTTVINLFFLHQF